MTVRAFEVVQTDVIIIGAGLFGSVIADWLERGGLKTIVVDDARRDAGSRPAACLMRPSWFSSLGPSVYEPALQVLNTLYGLEDIRFRVGPARVNVHWVNPARVLRWDRVVIGRAQRPEPVGGMLGQTWQVQVGQGMELLAPYVVVAAGVWSTELAPVEDGLVGQKGLALLWPGAGEKLAEPVISAWAPYRQLVVFDRGDGLWAGDGSAIKAARWSQDRASAIHSRCRAAALSATGSPLPLTPRVLEGIRPYSRRKPCYLEQAAPGLWVATGGAKNGTLSAGWCAHKIGEELL